MTGRPARPRTTEDRAWCGRVRQLNYREIYPVDSPRHPRNLSAPPSDALAVLWLDSAGTDSSPKFAYLNHARLSHLHAEIGRILHGGAGPGAVERSRAMLRGVDRNGEASGA